MKSFLKNVLANIVAILLLGGILFFFFAILLVLVSANDDSTVDVKDNSVLTLDAKSIIVDSPTEQDKTILALEKQPQYVLLYDVLNAIKNAKTDKNIKGISIENDFMSSGLTQIDDVRAALEDFKKSGKFVYAYGNTVSQPSYYLGSVADQYFLNPAGGIELKGMSTEVIFFKNLAEKYGVNIEVIRHGKFKAAVEPFIRNEISPENKEQLSTLLNDIWSVSSKKIYSSRKMNDTQFKTLVDSLWAIIPQNSLKYALVDKLVQKSQYDDFIKSKIGINKEDDLNKISISKYISSINTENTSENKVAILYASGEIFNGEGYDNIYSENMLKEIKKIQEDDDVKAVVLRVNSPGGSANAADEILFELQQLKTKKPLMVSFGDYAASGGYYISMAGDKIYSEPNTITGSIGVFGLIPYYNGIATKNGVRSDIVKTNENSNFYSPINGLSQTSLSMLTKNVEQTYKRFVGFVMQNRKKSFEAIDALGGGRVWSGTHAKQVGLVDEIGTLNDAIIASAKKANLKNYSIEVYPKRKSKFEQFFSDISDEEAISSKLIKAKLGDESFKIYKMLTSDNNKPEILMQSSVRINLK